MHQSKANENPLTSSEDLNRGLSLIMLREKDGVKKGREGGGGENAFHLMPCKTKRMISRDLTS